MWEEREETHRRHETQNWSQKLSHKLCLKTKSKNKQKLFYKSWKGTGKFYRWIWDTNVKFLSSVIVLKYYTLTQPLRFQKYILGNSLNVENNHSLTDGHFFFQFYLHFNFWANFWAETHSRQWSSSVWH